MTKVIAVLNTKGGVGKTTIATNLAFSLKESGVSVLLVDSDPQGSLRDWNDASDGEVMPVIGLDRATTLKNLKKSVSKEHDIIVIDGAPQSAELAGVAVRSADLVLIPVTPSPFDVWACSDLVEIIEARHAVTENKPVARFLISRARKGTKLSKKVKEVITDYDLPVLKNGTVHREVYAQVASDGFTVHKKGKRNPAVKEMTAIKKEILEILNGV